MSAFDSSSIQPASSASSPGRRWGTWLWVILMGAIVVKAMIETDQHTTYPGFVKGSEFFLTDKDPYISSFWEYRYSPAFATAFSIFTLLPARLGGVLWSLTTLGVLWWGVQQLLRHVLPQRWGMAQREMYLGLVLVVALRGLWASQSTPLVIGLLCAAAAAIVQERWWRASYLLAIPVYIKVWPLAAGLLFLGCRPRQLTLRFVLAVASLSLIPLAVKSPTVVWWQYQNWAQALLGPMQVRHIYRDMWALWDVIAPPVVPRAYLAVQLGSALTVFGLCMWQRFKAPSTRNLCLFVLSLWGAWQLCVGPGVERNTYCLAAPLLAWGIVASHEACIGRGLMYTAFTLIMLFSFGACERELVVYLPHVLGALPIGALLFGVWTTWYARTWPVGGSASMKSIDNDFTASPLSHAA